VLLTPLVNDDEEHPDLHPPERAGAGSENANFSVPEINDLKAGIKSIPRSVIFDNPLHAGRPGRPACRPPASSADRFFRSWD
jgi:hypothetical protein